MHIFGFWWDGLIADHRRVDSEPEDVIGPRPEISRLLSGLPAPLSTKLFADGNLVRLDAGEILFRAGASDSGSCQSPRPLPYRAIKEGKETPAILGRIRMTRLVAVLIAAGVALCAAAAPAQAKGKIVGVSWSNFQEERWKIDEAAIRAAIVATGDKYISADAQSSAQKQLTDIESLIAQGANALIILAQDASAVAPAVQKAVDEGIAVIGYDRLIENPNAFYITFENKEVGRMQARAVFAVKPAGNYAFIKGSSADPNADFLFAGQMEVLKDTIAAGKIKNVGEAYTDLWLPANAQKNMEQILTRNANKVDAVVAANDGTAGGAIAALAAQGLAGAVPVSGQDGDHAALNRIALGTQTVSVWKDSRALGRKAAEVAAILASGTKLNEVPGTVKFSGGPKHVEMNSLLLTPVPITKDNLDIVIDANWIKRDEVCQGVKPGSVKVCG
jgi:D-xylose transport system substrate-binding protein